MTVRLVILFSAAASLALVHTALGRFRAPAGHSAHWRSFGSGLAVGYVFMYALPALGEGQAEVEESGVRFIASLPSAVFFVALVGFVLFYGIERVAALFADREEQSVVFWLHIGAFGMYNGFIGFALHDHLAQGVRALLLFTVAMAFHLAIIDYGLQEHHAGTYVGTGQRILAGAVLVGAGIGYLVDLSVVGVFTFAVLTGGIILNTVKEELPEGAQGRFWAFGLGAVGYTVLLALL